MRCRALPAQPPLLLALLILLPLAEAGATEGLRQCRAVADAAARLACYDALPLPAAAAAAPPAASAAAATAAAPDRFGLPQPRERSDARVDSRIDGRFEGWRPRDRIRLANGQVWQVIDGSSGSYWLDSPRAVVRSGALGSFLMEIEGVKALIRVQRVE